MGTSEVQIEETAAEGGAECQYVVQSHRATIFMEL